MLITDIATTYLSDTERTWLKHPQLSGIILFARNIVSPEQVSELCAEIRACNPHLLITVDQEGGRVARLRDGFVTLPPLRLLGTCFRQAPSKARILAFAHGWLMAHDVMSVGIDVSFAPVLDIDHSVSEIIGDRAFSDDRTSVIALAVSYLQGMRAAGMKTVGKHFPGHGGVVADTHTAIAQDMRARDLLLQSDADVFFQLHAYKLLDAVMTAHVCYPAVSEQIATFSTTWLGDILRTQCAFQGIIFSDDLSMYGVSGVGGIEVRIASALAAGCDCVLICNNSEDSAHALRYLSMRRTSNRSLNMYKQPTYYTHRQQMYACPIWRARVAALDELASNN